MLILFKNILVNIKLGQEKNFGSVPLIIENWSGGPEDFLIHKPKFSKSNKCQHADMGADAEFGTWRCEVLDAR